MNYTDKDFETYLEKLVNKFKQDPQWELKQELGQMLTRHIDTFTEAELSRYYELQELLK